MVKSASPCKIGMTQKLQTFSEPEIEAARLLVQLSESDSDYYNERNNSSNNSNSVQQGKTEQNRVDSSDVSSKIEASNIFEEKDDEILGRRKKRFRYISEIYRITEPVNFVKAKKMKCM
ncbi:hypothetical protein O6P43_012263 [Quillaja saponaria]|uniref:Uncharacterized protein n=1 Tax=Quillaja saponaria TaxID=32244 RepID=A0AAD7PU78_QUISA|nr:hypothetical protein O6P43_012263 [Quillaja saponaria]